MNKIVKKTMAAAMALTLVAGAVPSTCVGFNVLKPTIVANAEALPQNVEAAVGVTVNNGDYLCSFYNNTGAIHDEYYIYFSDSNGQSHKTFAGYNLTGDDNRILVDFNNEAFLSDSSSWTLKLSLGVLAYGYDTRAAFDYITISAPADRALDVPDGLKITSGDGTQSNPFQLELVYSSEPQPAYENVTVGKKWLIGDTINTDAYFKVFVPYVGDYQIIEAKERILQFLRKPLSTCNQSDYEAPKSLEKNCIEFNGVTAGDFGHVYYFPENAYGSLSGILLEGEATSVTGIEVIGGSGTQEDPFKIVAIGATAPSKLEVNMAIRKINDIGTVEYTEASLTKITAARTAYDDLTDEQKELVTNYAKLTAAETTYSELAETSVLNDVINKIKAIGTVEYTEASLEKITAARTAYNALTLKQKALVTNYTTLTSAETTYNTLAAEPQNIVAAAGVTVKNGDYLCSFYNNTGQLQDEYYIYFSDSNGHIHKTCAGFNLNGEDNRILVDFNKEGFLSESSSWTFFSVLHSQSEMTNTPSPSFTISAPADRALDVPDGLKITSGDGTQSNPFQLELVYSSEPKPAYENVTVGKKWLIGDTINTDAYFKVDVPILGDYDDIYTQEKTLQFLRKPLSTCVKSNYAPYSAYTTKSYIEFNGITTGAFDYHYMAEQYEFYSNILLEGDVDLVTGIEVTSGSGTKADPFTIAPIYANIVKGASLTLDSDIGVNFYTYVTDEVEKAVLSGPDGDITINKADFDVQADGSVKLTYPINATQTESTIKLKLYGASDQQLDIYNSSNEKDADGVIEYSAQTYIDNADQAMNGSWSTEKKVAFAELVTATQSYADISEAYFNDGAVAAVTDEQVNEVIDNTYDSSFTTDEAKLSLVLDSKLAARIYIKDKAVEAGAAAEYTQYSSDTSPWYDITAKAGGKAGVYFEIPGLAPTELHVAYRVKYNGKYYNFSPLTWSRRVMNNPNSTDKNKAMAYALYEYYKSAAAFANS